jgi:transglutaminase-like putative cysteine protease
MSPYLAESLNVDFSHSEIEYFLNDIKISKNQRENAINIYLKVRDSFIYDPYHLNIRRNHLKASNVVLKKRAWCVEKSLLMVACCRALEIPARLGFAIVANHIGVEKLIKYLKRNEIVFHGYVEVFLNEKWIKCTPAFDKNVCRLSKVAPLDWDGENDSMFQEYSNGNKFMEYLQLYGEFSEIPFELMHAEMKKYYPHLFKNQYNTAEFSFIHD